MTDLVGELRTRRLVRELDPIRRPGAGRPTRPITLDGDPWCVLGVHIEVDRIAYVGCTVGGRELWRDEVAADFSASTGENGYAVVDASLRRQLERVPGSMTVVALEVGLPGYVTSDGRTTGSADGFSWTDAPLGRWISETLLDVGIRGAHVGVDTECHLAALHAVRLELHLPADTVAAYLGGSRSISSGVIVDGDIYRGTNGGAGDFAHLNVDPAGPYDLCGRTGCLESMVGPKRLLVQSGLRTREQTELLVRDTPRDALDLIAAAAEAGDDTALDALSRAGQALGRAVDDIIGVLNPHVVILGGYLGVLSPHLMPAVEAAIAERVRVGPFSGTTVVALPTILPRVVGGATLAARDSCLYDPLGLTTPLPA
jgi:predicted NBD/HSP70 family sugar kinase